VSGLFPAFGIQVFHAARRGAEIHTGAYILSGVVIGSGWCLHLSLRGWPVLLRHLNHETIKERLDALSN
jgi:hypothetical protein